MDFVSDDPTNNKQQATSNSISAADVAAGYQAAIVDVLVEKMRRAAQMTGIRTLCVGGGVAANRSLQNEMQAMCDREGLRLVVPDPVLCTDNAAMIACAGYFRLREHGPDTLALDTYASEPLASGVRDQDSGIR